LTQPAISPRQLNRSTLARQLLLDREAIGVGEAVRRVVAVQAQQPASPYVGLWNRIVDFEPTDLDAAFARQEVVKAPLMRATLHAVHADDYPPSATPWSRYCAAPASTRASQRPE